MSKRNSRKNRNSKANVLEQLEQRRLMAAINVTDFGARPNDGIDDTNAIRSAINASKPGDTVVFSGGTYNVNDKIRFLSHRTYNGGGTIARTPGQDFIADTDGENTNIKINNLTFQGGGIHAGNGMARGMEITGTTFQNITRGWPTGNAILVSAGAENSKFNNNKFLNIMGETGIYGFNRFHNVEMNNNYFDTVMEGIHLYYENGGDNLHVKNNTFIRMRRMCVELQGKGARNTLVENNKASEWIQNYHESFFLSIVNLGYNTVIRNNHGASGKFGEIDPKANITPVGIEISGWGVLVEGNVVEGFREGAHTMNIRDLVMRNNKFYNQTWMAVWRTGVSYGEFNGSNLLYENNEIYNPKGTAFLFHGYSSGTVRNNKIMLFGNAAEYQEGSGGALKNMSRPGNQVTRMSGSPQGYTGQSPIGNTGGGGGGSVAFPPSAPSGVQVAAKGPTQIDVAWNDNSNDEKGFKVYRRLNTGDPNKWDLIADLGANTKLYKDGGVTPGNHYSYKVVSYNDNGTSSWSNEHDAHTPTEQQEPQPTAPAAPSGVQVAAKGSNRVDIKWIDNSNNETGFRLYRRDNRGDFHGWELIANLAADTTSYVDNGAKADMHYSYKLVAVNAQGTSAWSNEHDAKTTPADTEPTPITPPPAPSSLEARAINRRVIETKWSGMGDDVRGVKIYRREGGDGEWVFIAQMDGNASNYKDGEVEAGKTYSYRVRSFNLLHSNFSNEDAAAIGDNEGPKPHVGNGNGLTGEYFSNPDFTGSVLKRSEAVNFSWNIHAPAAGMPVDNFSVRWTGQILAQYTEQYSFYVTADDGVRLWVDGKLIIDNFSAQPEKTNVGKIVLEAGKTYDVKLEYFEDKGHASAMLGWASRSQPYQIVPKSQLLSAPVQLAA
jgi:fibronectin type 3 domain-containing protein